MSQKNQVSRGSISASNNISTVSETGPKPARTTSGKKKKVSTEEATQPVDEPSPPVRVFSRIIFLKMGQIDTRNERYDAEAYIECTWEDDEIFKYLSSPNLDKDGKVTPQPVQQSKSNNSNTQNGNTNIINVKNVINNINFLEYDPNLFWSPQLYIENAIGDLKEDFRYKLEIVEKKGSTLDKSKDLEKTLKSLSKDLTVKVTEMRKVRGLFYERLELYDFPMDIQELSITLTSRRSNTEVEVVENRRESCSINIEDFLDQQEWDLFDFVKLDSKIIEDPWRKYQRSAFMSKSYISRKPGYYLYNAYMLIFLITMLGFVPFAFDPNGPQFRCQVTGLLILTSVNFRWVVTQRLPSVPYLTSLDKYAIGSLFHLVFFCIWHSIIGSDQLASDGPTKKLFDCYFLIGATILFLFYNVFEIFWFLKMFRQIKKFLNDGQAEAKKIADERAIEFAEPPPEEEPEPEPIRPQPSFKFQQSVITNNNNNNTSNNNNTNTTSTITPKQMNRGNPMNSSFNQKTASGNPIQPKNLMVSASPQPQKKTNHNMMAIDEETSKLMRVNSIGMKNMIKCNQKLNAV